MSALLLPAAPASSLVPPPPMLPGGLGLPSGWMAIMDILNVTPDFFLDGGRYTDVAAVLRHAYAMAAAGADLTDVDGGSTRPNPTRISADEEWARICIIVELLAIDGAIVLMDTLHASMVREATRVGTTAINDVSGGHWDPEMNAAVAESGCAYIVQHYRAPPGMPGEHFDYGDDPVGTLIECVGSQAHDAIDAGVTADKIVVNPGLGFSLTGDQCWQILRELLCFLQGGYSVLAGAPRGRFVKALDSDADVNSADIAAYCMAAGAWTAWVHDVVATTTAITRKETNIN